MAAPTRTEGASAFSIFAALIGLAAFALAAIAIIVVSVGDDDANVTAGGDSAAAAQAPRVGASLSEFAIALEASVVPPNSIIEVVNNGAIEHDLAVKGTDLATATLPNGGSDMVDLAGLAPGTYDLVCTIPGHEGSGMITQITIDESATAPVSPGESAGGHGHADVTPEEATALDESMMASMMAFPAETEGKGNVPLEPVSIEADGTKVFELEASIIEWEVSPGEIVDAWAYNGQVPGPWIDLEVGDSIRVEFTNNTPLGSDIHWHGITLQNQQDGVAPYTQDIVSSGDSFTYEFTVIEPMVAMYHAHAHSQDSVPNGMFGAITVGDVTLPAGQTVSGFEIPADIEIAQELPMVLNDAGVIGYSLNGKGFPATEPIVADVGDWVMVHYYSEGLQIHPMHLHGFRQLVIAKDGIPLDQPYWVDTLNIAPGERYTVIFQVDQPGVWVFHCHILTHVERTGEMFGMVTAVVANEPT
ncbi:MAG TPA: multicopper oxidase domain-containing protein [Acidimicrobiales bacterium]|nr:multicopper oxidase domain-containing protein [Acidimicrobiales bacterium]